jgi:hypothetical protein
LPRPTNTEQTITVWRPSPFRAGPSELKSVSFAFDIGANQKNCNSWRKAFNRAKEEPPEGQTLEFGWRESLTAGIEPVYTREGPHQIESLYCNQLGYCGSSICLLPNVTFIIRFPISSYPKSQWTNLSERIEDSLGHFMIDRPSPRTDQK